MFVDVLEAKGIAWPNPSMWRAPTLANTSMSTSNFQSDEGPQSHAHSPRHQSMRQSLQTFGGGQRFASSSVRRAFQPNGNAFVGSMGFHTGPPSVPCVTAGGMGMAPDPLSDMTYYTDWTMPTPFPSDFAGKPMWAGPGLNAPGMSDNGSGMMQTDQMTPADTYAPFQGEAMHISGPSLEDDEPMPTTNLGAKVPTNTPTAGSTLDPNSATASVSFQLDSTNTSSFMTPDFAHSLTHSLLNQPLPIQPQNIQPQNIPLPASEVKSRKERDGRFLTIHGSNPVSAFSTPQGAHPDIRKFSQPLFDPASSLFSATTTSSMSPASATLPSATASQNASNTDLGSSAATTGSTGTPIPLRNSSAASVNAAAQSSCRKRTRNFTPASIKVIDDEDQPLRPSPHMRASFAIVDDESDQ